jgi:predicted site-specific integrase-resolvase
VARVTGWATGNGMSADRVVIEVGPALSGKRKEFLALLCDLSVATVVVEHRDRFARFGVDYIEALLSVQDCRLVVEEEAEPEEDLVRDMTGLLACLCARLYGRRAAKNKAAAAMPAIGAAG